MKLQVLQENLAKSLTLASRYASTKAQLPVLGNILLSAKKTKLLIASTNLEVSIAISVGASVKEDGDITIPARAVTEVITNLPKESIELDSEKEHLKISSSNFTSTLLGMNPSDFPAIPQTIDKSASLSLPSEDLEKALSKVLFATSIDETRPVLTGVLFIFEKESLILVAADGFRLSQMKLSLPKQKGVSLEKVILPKGALSELTRLSDVEEIYLSFKEKDSQVVFGVGDIVLSSRILEGEFPNFESIIPKESVYKINLDKEDLLRAVKLAGVFARDSANIVKVKLGESFLEIFAESSQAGSQKTKVEAQIEGKKTGDFEIAFNYRFLEEFLNVVEGEGVKIEFSNSQTPGVFTDPKNPDFLHLIMPVKIQD